MRVGVHEKDAFPKYKILNSADFYFQCLDVLHSVATWRSFQRDKLVGFRTHHVSSEAGPR